MFRLSIACLTVCVLLVGVSLGQETPAEDAPKADSPKFDTIIYPPRSTPVQSLASALSEFLKETSTQVTAEPVSNVLLIRVESSNREALIKLLAQLDKAPRAIAVQMTLLKSNEASLTMKETAAFTGPTADSNRAVSELDRAARAYTANRLELSAIENQRTMIQIGAREAVVTGVHTGADGKEIKSYNYQNTGLILSVMARASDDGGVTMAIQFEKSELVPADEKQDEFTPPDTATLSHQTTIHIRDGHTVLAGTLVNRNGDKTEEAYLLVSAAVQEFDGAKPVTFRSLGVSTPPRNAARPRPTGPTTRGSGARPPSSQDRSAQMARYFDALFERHDENEDDVLTPQEYESMRTKPTDADSDDDGKISKDEFRKWMTNRYSRSRP